MNWFAGCVLKIGAGGGTTVTTAARLSVEPFEFVTRTQYEVVLTRRGVVKAGPLAPMIGVVVVPLGPSYH
jgi:hypothetical protein